MLTTYFLNSYHKYYIKNISNIDKLSDSDEVFKAKDSLRRVWIACSGGRDSMVLAHLSQQLYLAKKIPFQPILIHVNHGLQKANDDWEKLVVNWSDSIDMPCHVVKAKLNGKNEQAARQARYQAIMTLMSHGDVLMLGHHANDQAETMLMRLFQGAGVNGLSAMKAWTTRTTRLATNNHHDNNASNSNAEKTIYLWRPLLLTSREQITEYAHNFSEFNVQTIKQNILPYVDDPTNLDGDNIRSWLRKDLFPEISNVYPQAINSMSRSSNLLNDAQSILSEVFMDDLAHCYVDNISTKKLCEVISIDKVKSLSSARQSQLIHRWIQGSEQTPPNHNRVLEVLDLVHRTDNNQQTELDWQGQIHSYSIRRYRQHLYRLQKDWLEQLNETDVQYIKNLLLKRLQDLAIIDAHDCHSEWTLRYIDTNDKVALHKNGTAKSGKKLMQSLSVPSWERNTVKVLINPKNEITVIVSACSMWILPLISGKGLEKLTLTIIES